MDTVAGLMAKSREKMKYAKFTKGDYVFSAKEVNGRVTIYVNGVKKSRAYAEELLRLIK